MKKSAIWQLAVMFGTALAIIIGVVSCSKNEEPKKQNPQDSIPQANANHMFGAPDSPLNDKDISVFRDAIYSAGLNDIFVGTGPFTAFIPNNAAFEKIGKDKLKDLFKPENRDKLTHLVTYHIVPGKYMTISLQEKEYRTVNGKPITITIENDVIKVNGAKIIQPDNIGPNGVFHKIDTVLEP